MSDEIDEATEAKLNSILDELAETSLESFSKLIQYTIGTYSEKLDSDYLAINQVLVTMSALTGELLAYIPEEDRDRIEGKVRELISHRRKITESYEDSREAETETDLANMKPLGNC